MNMHLLFCFFAVLALLQSTKAASASVEFSSTNDAIALRTNFIGQWSIANLWTGIYWNSLELDGNATSLTGDYIWGSVGVHTGSCPVNWVAYFSADLEVHRDIGGDPSQYDWTKFTVDASSAFIASSYLRIYELDHETGEQVKNLTLDGIWVLNNTESQTLTNDAAGLTVSVFNHHKLLRPEQVQLTYIMTEQAGQIGNLDSKPWVAPKAVESVIKISNWAYEKPNNALHLVVAVGAGSSSFSSYGDYSSGTGKNAVFCRFARGVVVDGKEGSVSFDHESGHLVDFDNADVQFQLAARYQGSATVSLIDIAFPAGALEIEYDPMTGAGQDPYYDDGWTTGMIVLLSFGCFVALILIVLIIFFAVRSRRGYENVK